MIQWLIIVQTVYHTVYFLEDRKNADLTRMKHASFMYLQFSEAVCGHIFIVATGLGKSSGCTVYKKSKRESQIIHIVLQNVLLCVLFYKAYTNVTCEVKYCEVWMRK